MRRVLLASLCALIAVLTMRGTAQAAERWVDRPMTLHRLVFAGDVGMGIGHRSFRPLGGSATGAGLNLEGAIGITERVELGLRTGVRFGDEARFVQADHYGRTLWTETWGTRVDTVANPEFRVRWTAYSGSVVEVGLDGRIFMPIEDRSRFGMMFGVPFAFHVADFLRIDLGIYTPIAFYDPTFLAFSVPAYFWFQVSEAVWLGPMTSLRFTNLGNNASETDFLLGFGLGIQVASAVDLKTMLLFPAIDDATTRNFGAGFGVQFRIGE
jgi:hypothetical protein